MPAPRTIRWGIIGCGDVTEVKSGPALQRADHSRLVAVMRRNGALAADYARRHGVPRWHDDADAIIDAADIDAVYIATTPASHHDLVLRCAAAGKPVLVEKPMALDHAQCMAMIDACLRANVPLWVAYYRRALPRFRTIRDLVLGGAIGDVRMVLCRQFKPMPAPAQVDAWGWRTDPQVSGGGLFADMMSHTLDFLDYTFGAVTSMQAFAASAASAQRIDDTIAAVLRFDSGVMATISVCYVADRDEEYNEIVGTTGRIVFSTSRATPIQLFRGDALEEVAVGDPPHVHQPLVQTIVDEMNGGDPCPSTGVTGARTNWVIDEILREFRQRSP